MNQATIINGDARRLPLADGSVHCVVTSPPYFGLRSYGVGVENGEIGLEATPDAFVATMVRVFREVKRVLRDDGTAWVNLGDSYSSSPGKNNENLAEWCAENAKGGGHRAGSLETPTRSKPTGLGPKQLLMMPHRVALALQADGWIVRSDIVWAKPNPMPESVTDRPTKSHEYVFLLSKRERYFYDAENVREKQFDERHPERGPGDPSKKGGTGNSGGLLSGRNEAFRAMDRGADRVYNPSGRNLRSVWTIPTHAFPGAHFATFPPALVSRCVKAGTSEKGCCPSCGAGWERVVERESCGTNNGSNRHDMDANANGSRNRLYMNLGGGSARSLSTTLGWRPSCSCPDHAPIPCTVLDPFCGSGTTGVVATGLNRRFVGVDLSPDYCRMAVRRISRPHASHRTARPTEALPLFAGFE